MLIITTNISVLIIHLIVQSSSTQSLQHSIPSQHHRRHSSSSCRSSSPVTTTLHHMSKSNHHYQSSSSPSNDNDDLNSSTKPKKIYPPTQFKIINGKKYRLCAAAAVINASGQILIGERAESYHKDTWQAPQGGVDVGETIRNAAVRELYEEMGLVLGKHVVFWDDNNCDDERGGGGVGATSSSFDESNGYRYESVGSGGWMPANGYVGQELHWVLFKCVDDTLEHYPKRVCELEGKNGERAEFCDVKWATMDVAIEGVWEKKRELYMALGERLKRREGDDI